MELINVVKNKYGDIKGEVEITSLIFNDKIVKPDFQRDLDVNRCEELVKKMNDFFEKNSFYKIVGTIYLANVNDTFYLIDGQHRLHAAQIVYNLTNIDIYVDLHVYHCKNLDEVYELFQKLNFNKEIPKWMHNDNKDYVLILKNVMNKFENKYGDIIVKNDVTVQFPKFNISKFFDISKKYNVFCQFTENQIIDYLENLNNNIYMSLEKYKSNDNVSKKLSKLLSKTKFGIPICYLGTIRLSGWDKFFRKKYYLNVNEDIIFNLFTL